MTITVNINGKDVEITLTPEQIAKASNPKLFEYTQGEPWCIGPESIDDGFDGCSKSTIKYGRYRRTKEAAKIDFKRQTRMMRLSALAWEVGECKEFKHNEDNWYVSYDGNHWGFGIISRMYEPEKVYMTEDTAIKVCKMLNNGEYSLDVE